MTPEELKLARQRLAMETRLKRVDQQLAREQLEIQKSQSTATGWKALATPAGGILVAATLGLFGTAAGKWADNSIERNKQQTTIILKASEVQATLTPEQQEIQRARNLLWFAKAGYVSLPKEFVDQLEIAAALSTDQFVPPPVIQSQAPQAPSQDVTAVQRALGIVADGMLGASARAAIREFQDGLNRRDAREPPGSGGPPDPRTLSLLAVIGPMPADLFSSPFERAYLGTRNGGNAEGGLSKVDPNRLEQVLRRLEVPLGEIPSGRTAADTAGKLKRMRDRILAVRIEKQLRPEKGGILDAQFFDAVLAGSN